MAFYFYQDLIPCKKVFVDNVALKFLSRVKNFLLDKELKNSQLSNLIVLGDCWRPHLKFSTPKNLREYIRLKKTKIRIDFSNLVDDAWDAFPKLQTMIRKKMK